MQAFYLPHQGQQADLNSSLFFFDLIYHLIFINHLFLKEHVFIGKKG